jgi:MraZ protein
VLFTGEFPRSIDDKGRLIVPSRLRDLITDDKVVLTQGVEPCIAFWPEEQWSAQARELLAQPQSAAETRRTVRQLAGKGHTDRIDKQGRITVPQHLRDRAGIDSEVVIVGMLNHAEIWSPERYAEEEAKQEETPLEERFGQLNI